MKETITPEQMQRVRDTLRVLQEAVDARPEQWTVQHNNSVHNLRWVLSSLVPELVNTIDIMRSHLEAEAIYHERADDPLEAQDIRDFLAALDSGSYPPMETEADDDEPAPVSIDEIPF